MKLVLKSRTVKHVVVLDICEIDISRDQNGSASFKSIKLN